MTTDDHVPGDATTEVELTDEEARAHIGGGGIDRRRTIIGAVVAIVFLAIVFARVIPQIGDYAAAASYVEAMTGAAIASLVIVVLLYLWIYGWPFVAATPGLRYRDGFIVNQSAFTVSNGIPAGGAFGLGLQYAQLTSYGASPTVTTAAIGATGLWSVFVTLFLPVTGVTALALSGDDAGNYLTAAVIGIAALVALIGTFAFILRSESNAERFGAFAERVADKVVGRFRPGTQLHLKAQVLRLRHDTVGLVSRRWHVITIAQIAVSWAQFAILYTALVGMADGGSAAPILTAYGCWAIAQLGVMIPLTPGGLGTVDAVMIALLTSFGVDNGQATAADLVWRASSYVPQIIVGLVSIFVWRWQQRHRH